MPPICCEREGLKEGKKVLVPKINYDLDPQLCNYPVIILEQKISACREERMTCQFIDRFRIRDGTIEVLIYERSTVDINYDINLSLIDI